MGSGVTVRRLLAVARGGASYVAALVHLTSAPLGGGTQIQEPRFVYHNDVLYMGFTNGSTGAVTVQAVGGSPITLRTFTVDSHTCPALLPLSDDHLFVAYSDHGGGTMYGRRSTSTLTADPLLADGFDAEVTIRSGGTMTYPTLVQLVSLTNDPLRCYMRVGTGTGTTLLVRQSTDQGATWSGTEVVWDANLASYWKISTDGLARVDFFCSDANPDEAASSVFHFYDDGSVYRDSDGTNIGASPHSPSTGTTEIYDSSDGPAWVTDAKLYGTTPVCVINIDNGSLTDSEYRRFEWDGATWAPTTILASVGAGVVDPAPVACLDDNDQDRLWGARYVSGTYEVWQFTSAGVGHAVTSGSGSVKNIYPARVHGTGTYAMAFQQGTYTDFNNYSVGIVAVR